MSTTIPQLPDNTDVSVNISASEYDWVQKTVSMECKGDSGHFVASFTYEGTNMCIAEYITYKPRDEVSLNKVIQTFEFSSDTFNEYFKKFLKAQLECMENNPHESPKDYEKIAIDLFNTVLAAGSFIGKDIVPEYIED